MPPHALLVVDDQPIFRAQFRAAVEQTGLHSSFGILEAEDGARGLEVLEANPDVAFMVVDVHMPTMDGPTMLEHLARSNPTRLRDTRTFMMTTESDPQLRARCKELGVLAWLIKPVRPAKFLEWLKAKFLEGDVANG